MLVTGLRLGLRLVSRTINGDLGLAYERVLS